MRLQFVVVHVVSERHWRRLRYSRSTSRTSKFTILRLSTLLLKNKLYKLTKCYSARLRDYLPAVGDRKCSPARPTDSKYVYEPVFVSHFLYSHSHFVGTLLEELLHFLESPEAKTLVDKPIHKKQWTKNTHK